MLCLLTSYLYRFSWQRTIEFIEVMETSLSALQKNTIMVDSEKSRKNEECDNEELSCDDMDLEVETDSAVKTFDEMISNTIELVKVQPEPEERIGELEKGEKLGLKPVVKAKDSESEENSENENELLALPNPSGDQLDDDRNSNLSSSPSKMIEEETEDSALPFAMLSATEIEETSLIGPRLFPSLLDFDSDDEELIKLDEDEDDIDTELGNILLESSSSSSDEDGENDEQKENRKAKKRVSGPIEREVIKLTAEDLLRDKKEIMDLETMKQLGDEDTHLMVQVLERIRKAGDEGEESKKRIRPKEEEILVEAPTKKLEEEKEAEDGDGEKRISNAFYDSLFSKDETFSVDSDDSIDCLPVIEINDAKFFYDEENSDLENEVSSAEKGANKTKHWRKWPPVLTKVHFLIKNRLVAPFYHVFILIKLV